LLDQARPPDHAALFFETFAQDTPATSGRAAHLVGPDSLPVQLVRAGLPAERI